MELAPISLTIYPIIFLLGILVGWLTQRFRVNGLRTRLEDKAAGLRDAQKSAAKLKEEVKFANLQTAKAENKLGEYDLAVDEMRREISATRKQLAGRDAIWRDRLEVLQSEFSKKEQEFQRISAVTTGFVPLRKQLQHREEEVSFLRMQVQQILANHGEGLTKEDIENFSHQLYSQPGFHAEISRLEARIKELETEVVEAKSINEIVTPFNEKNGITEEDIDGFISKYSSRSLDSDVIDKKGKENTDETDEAFLAEDSSKSLDSDLIAESDEFAPEINETQGKAVKV